MTKKINKPNWVPENAGNEFTTKIISVSNTKDSNYNQTKIKENKILKVDDYVSGVLKNDRTIIAKTITLVESNSPKHYHLAQEILNKLLPYSGNSIRIGITGLPGSGKSTLIETLGLYLLKKRYKVAVLTIDPSSTITKGSILGDKTRMEKLSKEENCFIRPSPSGGALGGVARKSRETILICESAGYDVILVETVGVGQSEISVRTIVDFFLLLIIAGAGDDLQVIKKGVMELADAIYINKYDGENKTKALLTKNEFSSAIKYIPSATKDWQTKIDVCSAVTGEGIEELWMTIESFFNKTKANGIFEERRKRQMLDWTFDIVEENLKKNFYSNEKIRKELKQMKQKILKGVILPSIAAETLLSLYFKKE